MPECEFCGDDLTQITTYNDNYYCSEDCVLDHIAQKEGQVLGCAVCDNDILVNNATLHKKASEVVCDADCKSILDNTATVETECSECGATFERNIRSNKQVCSAECEAKSKTVEVECSYRYCDETHTLSKMELGGRSPEEITHYCIDFCEPRDKKDQLPHPCDREGCDELVYTNLDRPRDRHNNLVNLHIPHMPDDPQERYYTRNGNAMKHVLYGPYEWEGMEHLLLDEPPNMLIMCRTCKADYIEEWFDNNHIKDGSYMRKKFTMEKPV